MSGTESSIVAGRRVAVVGAGAAGISAAFWLRRAGAHVRVLEAGEQVGGRCRTVERDGFRFDI
ncbi:MAG: 1-hydroxy-2-isopentenylcarotenoid 3,4-desaturase, partial [Pseudonocardiales bacterium]|nr:1-hydroxy-2-isopentenylcarotenoid 3,4-desaturase [Pseudonocardiales bacterium]